MQIKPQRSPIPVADAGLQPERTAMSWTRTALAMMVCSITLLRWSRPYSDVVLSAIALLAVISIAIIARNRAEYRHEAIELSHEHAEPNVFGVFAITAGMVLLGLIGLYLVVQA